MDCCADTAGSVLLLCNEKVRSESRIKINEKILAKWQKTIYSIQKELFRDEVCRKRCMSTEGVKLSGAGGAGATVNGSTLWRHPDSSPGAEGATYIQGYMNLSGKRTEKISF